MIRSACTLAAHPKHRYRPILVCLLVFAFGCAEIQAQIPASQPPASTVTPSADSQQIADIEHRLNDVTAALSATQQALEKSLLEVQRLRSQLDALRAHGIQDADKTGAEGAQKLGAESKSPAPAASAPSNDDLKALKEEQDTLQAEIKQHEQIKVETSSKYPLRVTGLVLFNAFSNAGVVDNVELPTLALPRYPGSSHGSNGATMRQTLLGLQASGPRIAGARSSAQASIDFFGGVSPNAYGYNASAGLVRMRESRISLDWEKTTLEAGYTEPLISPLSPTSFATVAQPALSGSGNLWTWSPQVRVEQRIPLPNQHLLAFEGGLIYPQSPGYTSVQLDSPVEASRRPGYEGRISYRNSNGADSETRPLMVGVGAYSSSQFYSSNTQIHAWAVTADWQIPIFRWFDLSGEAYRGRALGGLGGGAYKDVLSGTDVATGLPRTTGVDTVGGWSQLKVRFAPAFQANAAFGLDDALSSNFDGLILSTSANPLEFYARNSTVLGNLIYRPKTYLIFSPEYRRILSWRYTGPPNVANVFTLTAGFEF